jgi:hypothetical protein
MHGHTGRGKARQAHGEGTRGRSSMSAGWAVKLPPRLTGLPMAVWITANEGAHQHDVRVEASKTHDGGAAVGLMPPRSRVRPHSRGVAPGSLTETDFVGVSRWIELNQALIVDYWNGWLEIDDVLQRLQRLP